MSSNESGGQVLDGQQRQWYCHGDSKSVWPKVYLVSFSFSSECVQWMNSYWLCFIWCLVIFARNSGSRSYDKTAWPRSKVALSKQQLNNGSCETG
mmetsp:Transcript_16027/g.26225  ORF Transcript_16027/g.26225 Transcript_16027/m.26225 type:complete len:95 (-) Transcript_16027:34-318(-)